MKDDADGPLPGSLEIVEARWKEFCDAVELGEYEYKLTKVVEYDDDDRPPEIPQAKDRIVTGGHMFARVTFNGYTNSVQYSNFLKRLAEGYKDAFLAFIDNVNYSVSERLQYFYERLEEIAEIRAIQFSINEKTKVAFRKQTNILNQGGDEAQFWAAQEEINNYGDEIYDAVAPFVNAQFESLLYVERLVDIAARFIPGRLDSYETKADGDKLPFHNSRVELLVLMLALRDLGIIDVESDHQLGKFMERNFLYNRRKSLKALEAAMSQYRSGDKSEKTSLENLREALKSLFEPSFTITR